MSELLLHRFRAKNKVMTSRRSRLEQVGEWEIRARRARYHVDALARACAISPRQLQRFFLFRFGKPPKSWLRALRTNDALASLKQGKSIKETAFNLGLRAPEELSREIKRVTGLSASQVGNSLSTIERV